MLYSDILNKIYNLDNLYWAWQKVKYAYSTIDFVYDLEEYNEFETDLDKKLQSISDDIKNGEYKAKEVVLLPLPKGLDENGKAQIRQNFYISVRDQVAWTALINIIGPILDKKMPFWSFGSRLYMPVWYDKEVKDNRQILIRKYGKYKISSKLIYRKWSTSWPLFRKAIYITIKKMASLTPNAQRHNYESDLTQEEIDEVDSNEAVSIPEFKIDYWLRSYWNIGLSGDIFWGSIDFSKFYPSVSHEVIIKNIKKYLFDDEISLIAKDSFDNLKELLNCLMNFKVKKTKLNKTEQKELTVSIDNDSEGNMIFKGIPTGLFVAGFLSNIAMLDVDNLIVKELKQYRKVAHFRFVDDHVFLSDDINQLITWINEYKKLIENEFSGQLKINHEKTKPNGLGKYFLHYEAYLANKRKKTPQTDQLRRLCRLDPRMPSPLMTQTLKKASGMNRTVFNLMDNNEKMLFIDELEHFLVTDFSEEELKKETRVSWAATMLNKVVPIVKFDLLELYNKDSELESRKNTISKLKKKIEKEEYATNKEKKDIIVIIKENEQFISKIQDVKDEIERNALKHQENYFNKVFLLVLKAVKDNFSKPRIWCRAVQFCQLTGYDGCGKLIELLNDIKKEYRINESTYQYLYAAILYKISECIIKCCIIHNSNDYTFIEKESQINFVKAVSFHGFDIKNPKGYFDRVNDIYNYALNFANTYMDLGLKSNNAKDSFDLLWWVLNKANFSIMINSSLLRNTLQNSITSTREMLIAQKIAILFVKNSELIKDTNILVNDKSKQIIAYQNAINESTKKAIGSFNKSITLCDWVIYTYKLYSENYKLGCFDVRLSEYCALEIIKAITKAVISKQNPTVVNIQQIKAIENEQIIINPQNFIMNFTDDYVKSKAMNSWHRIQHLADRLTVEYKVNVQEIDQRFCPKFYIDENQYESKSIIYGLGVLLACLLSRDLNFSPRLNICERIEKPYFLILDKIKNIPISTYTKTIIYGCLTMHYYETAFVDSFITLNNRNNGTNEPINIFSLDSLIDHINASQKILEYYQMNISSDQPRQLIPISLLQMNNTKNPYYKNMEDTK